MQRLRTAGLFFLAICAFLLISQPSLSLRGTAERARETYEQSIFGFNFRGTCDWADMYDVSDVPVKCWIDGSSDEPDQGDVILMGTDKELWSSDDPCSPEGRLASGGDNGPEAPTYCVYLNIGGYGDTHKRWVSMGSNTGMTLGSGSHYDGSAIAQNYSDATLVVFSRSYNAAGGGPLTNGAIVAVCNEDGEYGTDNDCDPFAVVDDDGDVQFLVETTNPDGEARVTTRGALMGNLDVVVTTGDTDSPSVDEMRGTLHVADNATATNDVDYTLPEISTIGVGANACFYDNGGGDGGIIIDAAAGDEILLNGTGVGVADAIDSPGVAGAGANGDYICIVAIDNTYWITLDQSGTWVDGGAD